MPKLDFQPNVNEVARVEAPHMHGILTMSPMHVRMLEFLIANPEASMEQLAAFFGRTPAWVSLVVHSDCFQAALKERQDEIFGDVRFTVRDRILALAHRSLERLAEKMEIEQETARITDAAELALKALGFGAAPAPRGGTVNNYVFGQVSRGQLMAARQLMERRLLPSPIDEGSESESPDAEQRAA